MQKIRKEIESSPPRLYNHKMKPIAFIDSEIEPRSGKVLDIGGVSDNGAVFHKASVPEFISFLHGTQFVCGHNIINQDTKYIGQVLNNAGIDPVNTIDTLFLSPLLFPIKPYHALLLLSSKIEQQYMNKIGVTTNLRLREIPSETKQFLDYHNEYIYDLTPD